MIQLEGERLDLEVMPTCFPNGDIFAVQEDGATFITGPAFDALPNAEAVLNCANQALNEFAAVASLLWNGFRKPTIRSVFRTEPGGKRNTFVFVSGIASIRFKPNAALSGAAISVSTQAQELLAAGRKSARLRDALMIWANPVRTWPRLYRVLEEIE